MNKTQSQIFWSCVIYNAIHHYCFTTYALMDKFQPLQILKQFTCIAVIIRESGSCLLWVMSTEISVDIAVDIAVESRSI